MMPHGGSIGVTSHVVALGVMLAACHHTNAGSTGRPAAEAVDTMVGQIHVVGVEPFPDIVLAREGGGPAVTLVGPPALGRLDGLRISVVGRSVGSRFRVREFTVVSANGVAATDGRLVADRRALYLVTADGRRHPLVSPSPNLWAHVGGRVWVAGPLDREPVAYGIIE
jgi:hypothetical protein